MALTKQQKEALVQRLHDAFSRSVIVIQTQFHGLTVAKSDDLRRKLREVDTEFRVAKNTLVRIAAKETQVEGLAAQMTGQNALAIGFSDPVAVAKVLVDFAKDNDALEVLGGILNGKIVDRAGIEALSKLPSREVLLAQLLSVLVATPGGLVQALAGIPRKVLYALKAIGESKS